MTSSRINKEWRFIASGRVDSQEGWVTILETRTGVQDLDSRDSPHQADVDDWQDVRQDRPRSRREGRLAARSWVFMSPGTSSYPISAYLVISTLCYTAQEKSLLETGSRSPTTDERVGSRSRRVGPCQCGVVRFRGVVMKVGATISRVYTSFGDNFSCFFLSFFLDFFCCYHRKSCLVSNTLLSVGGDF